MGYQEGDVKQRSGAKIGSCVRASKKGKNEEPALGMEGTGLDTTLILQLGCSAHHLWGLAPCQRPCRSMEEYRQDKSFREKVIRVN